MKIVKNQLTLKELQTISQRSYGNFVKAVVDIELGIMAVDAELHADEEALLLKHGSRQENLWGINLYPKAPKKNWVEFDSMINIRPYQNNHSRNVVDPKIQNQILSVVEKLVSKWNISIPL